MSDFRETRIERDAEGRIIGSTERIVERPDGREAGRAASDRRDDARVADAPKRKSGFGGGVIFGLVIAALALLVFVLSQGSFTEAGREADQAAAQAEQSVGQAAEQAGDTAERAGDNVERATDQ